MIKKICFIVIGFILYSSGMQAQTISEKVDTLSKLIESIHNPQIADYSKMEINFSIQDIIEEICATEKSFSFPFDSVKGVSCEIAPDNTFKLLTYVIPKKEGTFDFFGYLIFQKPVNDKRFIKLYDNTQNISKPETSFCPAESWYGALYYKIIKTKYQGKVYYTLLGWKGNSLQSTKKVIEVLYFKTPATIAFGSSIFKKDKARPYRIIFEYSANTSMLLRFDKQMVHTIVKPSKVVKHTPVHKDESHSKALKADKKTAEVVKTHKTDMIIFDRLSPLNPRTSEYIPSLEGQYQYYVPETNVFDAYIFSNGKWVFTKDVDARNPAPKKSSTKNKPSK